MLALDAKYRRIAALMMDMMLIQGIAKMLFIGLSVAFGIAFDYSTFGGLFMILVSQSIIATLYVLLCQKLYRGTLGKRLLNLELLNQDGKPLTTVELISREWSKWIILYFFSLIAIIVNAVLYFRSGRSLHDMLAKTQVV